MTEGKFYGIWNGKKNYWVHLSGYMGLFAAQGVGLRIVRGTLHNIRQNLGKGGTDYQIRRLGEDGLPTGEPLVTRPIRKIDDVAKDVMDRLITKEEAGRCRFCYSTRIALVSANCRDNCWVEIGDKSDRSYPPGWNISVGDCINFRYCLDCGQIQGKFPVALTYLEEGWIDESDK